MDSEPHEFVPVLRRHAQEVAVSGCPHRLRHVAEVEALALERAELDDGRRSEQECEEPGGGVDDRARAHQRGRACEASRELLELSGGRACLGLGRGHGRVGQRSVSRT